jgi:predicted DNA binding protein
MANEGRADGVSPTVDILAVFRVEHPDIALTRTVGHDTTATIRPIRQAGTDPESDRYLFSVTSEDFDRFEAGLASDPTVEAYERVIHLDDEAVYSFTYAEDSILLSTEIGRSNGIVVEMENVGTTWVVKTWFPSRESAQRLWDFAVEHGAEISLDRINEHGSIVSGSYGLTETQRDAILVALETGYFDEPRGVTLGEVARQLDISQPAASGLLRRGLKRLIRSTVAEAEEE